MAKIPRRKNRQRNSQLSSTLNKTGHYANVTLYSKDKTGLLQKNSIYIYIYIIFKIIISSTTSILETNW